MKNFKNNNVYHKPYTPPTPKTPPKSGIKSKIKNSLNKILFWVIISSFCLFTVGSTLGIIAFTRTAKAEENTARSYISSGHYLPTTIRPLGYSSSSPVSSTVFANFDFIVGNPESDANYGGVDKPLIGIRGRYYPGDFVCYSNNSLTENYGFRIPLPNETTPVNDTNNLEGLPLGDYYFKTVYLGYPLNDPSGYNNVYACVYVYIPQSFNGEVVIIREFSTNRTYPNAGGNSSQSYQVSARNNIHFVDTDGNVACFSFLVNVTTNYSLSQALYFCIPTKEYTIAENANADYYYNVGYQDGVREGILQGEQQGYDKGYFDGESAGYELGRIDGINQASNYTLYSLISAIFNVPLISFVHLINFEFFGVNLANFFTGCLTVGVILFIVSKLFGK